MPIGSHVRIAGVVTAEPGLIGSSPSTAALQDGDSGIALRVTAEVGRLARGVAIEVAGTIGQAYGMLDLRMDPESLVLLDWGDPPAPEEVPIGEVGESTEGRLVTVTGEIVGAPSVAASGDVSFDLADPSGARLRVVARAGSGIVRTGVMSRGRYRVTGIAGQRSTATGRLDGYRIWARDPSDLVLVGLPLPSSTPSPSPSASPSPTASASPSPSATPSPMPPPASIAAVIRLGEGRVRTEGLVTIPATLLDDGGRRTVIDDGSAAVELLLPAGTTAPRAGTRISVNGSIGRAYGAPRVRVTDLAVLGVGEPPVRPLSGTPQDGDEWRLVRIGGRVESLRRLGERWVAEVRVGESLVPVVGLPGAAIPPTALDEGRAVTVVGIVRRPYPSATDRRFAIVPRSLVDLAVGPASSPAAAPGSATSTRRVGPGGPATAPRSDRQVADPDGRRALEAPSATSVRTAPRIDLGVLDEHGGEQVTLSGIVREVAAGTVLLDDGTGTGRLELAEAAAGLLAGLAPGDALEASGEVIVSGGRGRLRVTEPGRLALLGALGERVAIPTTGVPENDGALASVDAWASVSASYEIGVAADPRAAGAGAPSHDVPPAGPTAFVVALLLGFSVSLLLVTLRLRRRPGTGTRGSGERPMVGS